MTRRSALTLVAGVTLVVTLATGCAARRTSVTPAGHNSAPGAIASTAAVSSAAPAAGSTASLEPAGVVPTTASTAEPSTGAAVGHAAAPATPAGHVTATAIPTTAAPTTAAPTTTPPAGQPAADASTLAAINQDLAGIDAGSSAADKDLSAGDSARAQYDEG